MSGNDANAEGGAFRIGPNGLIETLMATLASAALAGLILFMRARGTGYWLGGIAVLYFVSLRLSLGIHALSYVDGIFRAEPLLGKPAEFRGSAIASIAHDDRSRPPRARLELKDGRRILIKRPVWMGAVTAREFEDRIRARLAETRGWGTG